MEKFCNNPTSLELYKFLIRDKHFSEQAQTMLPKLKELFQMYNNKMRQIKHRQLIEQQKQMKSNALEEKFEPKPELKQDADDRTQNNVMIQTTSISSISQNMEQLAEVRKLSNESKPVLEQIAIDGKQNLKELVENDSLGKLLNSSNNMLLNQIDWNMNTSNIVQYVSSNDFKVEDSVKITLETVSNQSESS